MRRDRPERYKLNGVNMANLLGDVWSLGTRGASVIIWSRDVDTTLITLITSTGGEEGCINMMSEKLHAFAPWWLYSSFPLGGSPPPRFRRS